MLEAGKVACAETLSIAFECPESLCRSCYRIPVLMGLLRSLLVLLKALQLVLFTLRLSVGMQNTSMERLTYVQQWLTTSVCFDGVVHAACYLCVSWSIFFLPCRVRDLELENHHSKLQQEMRERMAVDGKQCCRICERRWVSFVDTTVADRFFARR